MSALPVVMSPGYVAADCQRSGHVCICRLGKQLLHGNAWCCCLHGENHNYVWHKALTGRASAFQHKPAAWETLPLSRMDHGRLALHNTHDSAMSMCTIGLTPSPRFKCTAQLEGQNRHQLYEAIQKRGVAPVHCDQTSSKIKNTEQKRQPGCTNFTKFLGINTLIEEYCVMHKPRCLVKRP